MNCTLILLNDNNERNITNIEKYYLLKQSKLLTDSFNKISLIYSAVLITAVISDYLLFFSDNTLIHF